MQNIQNSLSKCSYQILACAIKDIEIDEHVMFDVKQLLSMVSDICEVTNARKERLIVFALSLDRVKVTNNLHHVIICFNIVSTGAINSL